MLHIAPSTLSHVFDNQNTTKKLFLKHHNINDMKKILLFLLIMSGAVICNARGQKAKHIVYIGLDGWGAYSMPKADMPTVKSMMESGCYTLEKRTVRPSSSAPNWASMFMGAGPELHGYTEWGSKKPDLPSRVILKHNIFPTIFQILRDARPKSEIGVLYQWDGIKYLVDTLSLSYHALSPDFTKHPDALCQMSEEYIIDKKPELVAICFDEPDHVGHQIGHDTEAYYDKMKELDGYVARIVEATKKAGIFDDTVFIVTSDHGGINRDHGGITMMEMETPFVITGKGIKAGGKFEESMMQYDVASTMAAILGLKQPQVWIGRSMDQVFK